MPASETGEATQKWLPLDQILADLENQIRLKVPADRVRDFEAIIAEHGAMDPLVVFPLKEEVDGQRYLLADGFTRYKAYQNLEKSKAPCEIREGDRSQALEYAMRENGRHGLPLSSGDKRRAAEMAVADPRMGKWADKRIAKMLGISASLVGEARRGIKPEERKRRTEARKAASSGSGSGKGSGPAARPAQARERKPAEDANRPTQQACLRQIQDWTTNGLVEEQEVVKLFDSPTGTYTWTAKPGVETRLVIISASGETLADVKVVLKDLNEEALTVKVEGKVPPLSATA